MSKHTPGPWSLNHQAKHPWVIECPQRDMPDHIRGRVCEVGYLPNARLIAAAPEMLEALKLLHKWFEITGRSIDARWSRIPPVERKAIVDGTRAAIAKAGGRS